MEAKKAKDGTVWLDMMSGCYIGRRPDGRIALAFTNGLPPWDEKASAVGSVYQPEAFSQAVGWALDRASTPGAILGANGPRACDGGFWTAIPEDPARPFSGPMKAGCSVCGRGADQHGS